MHVWLCARPAAHVPKGPIERASATACNWRSAFVPYQKPKHAVGQDTVGLDLGPSTLAIVPREGTPRLEVLCSELAPDAQAIRRLQRQMERQRRANNPDHYDACGRIKKRGKQRLSWKHSKRSSFHPAP